MKSYRKLRSLNRPHMITPRCPGSTHRNRGHRIIPPKSKRGKAQTLVFFVVEQQVTSCKFQRPGISPPASRTYESPTPMTEHRVCAVSDAVLAERDVLRARGVAYSKEDPSRRKIGVGGSSMPIQQSGRVSLPAETLLRMLTDPEKTVKMTALKGFECLDTRGYALCHRLRYCTAVARSLEDPEVDCRAGAVRALSKMDCGRAYAGPIAASPAGPKA